MARPGYGYAGSAQINPRIIYCSGSDYGEDGPYVTRPGQDMLIQGLTGIMAVTGSGGQHANAGCRGVRGSDWSNEYG